MNPNVLSKRYATPDMNIIFSEEGNIRQERLFWVSVIKNQRSLGLDIPIKALDAYEKAVNDIDLQLIEDIERRTKHDVKAKIEAFCQAGMNLWWAG